MQQHDYTATPDRRDSRGLVCRLDTRCARGTASGALNSHPSRKWQLSVVVSIALASLSAGCGTQATIVLKDGNQFRGRIVERRDAFLVAEDDDQGVFGVPERDVKEVRHPGKGAMIAGGVLAGVGAVLLATGALRDCSDQNDDDYFDDCEFGRGMALLTGAASAASGVSLGVYGFAVHESSKARARGPRDLGSESRRVEGRGIGVVTRF